MNYKILSHDYYNTGGHCMVSVFHVELPDDDGREVYVNVGEGMVYITAHDIIRSDCMLEEDGDDICFEFDDYRRMPADDEPYYKLVMHCVYEYFKSDCEFFKYRASIGYYMLPAYIQTRVYDFWLHDARWRRYADNDFDNVQFLTDGYNVYIPIGYNDAMLMFDVRNI